MVLLVEGIFFGFALGLWSGATLVSGLILLYDVITRRLNKGD